MTQDSNVLITEEVLSSQNRWISIHGVVYNVEKFIDTHPGGRDVLLSACGRESGDSFDAVGHSKEAIEQLHTLLPKIGLYQPSKRSPEQEKKEERVFTAQEVAAHATEESAWIVLDGTVYDVTRFLPDHPGGSAVLLGCAGASDATAAFEAVGHSEEAIRSLVDHQIGVLSGATRRKNAAKIPQSVGGEGKPLLPQSENPPPPLDLPTNKTTDLVVMMWYGAVALIGFGVATAAVHFGR